MDLSDAVGGFLKNLSDIPYLIIEKGLTYVSNWNNGESGVFTVLMKTLNDLLTPIRESLQIYGICMLCIFFLISLIELGVSERMNLETFMKHFVKLCVGFWAVSSVNWIMESVLAIGGEITTVVSTAMGGDSIGGKWSTVYTSYGDMLKDTVTGNVTAQDVTEIMKPQTLGWLFSFLMGVVNFIPMLLIALVEMIVMLVLNIARVFEFTIRGVFLPIGVALLAEDGWHGSGGRYIKKFMSVSIQSALYIIIAMIGVEIVRASGTISGFMTFDNIVEGDVLGNILKNCISGISVAIIPMGAGIAAIAAMFKASQYTNDILGC